MGAYKCEFGVIHKVCRCPVAHTMKCDKVDEHMPKKETTGEWTHKEFLAHRCALPQWDATVSKFDRWKCAGCDKEWVVTRINSDGRNGAYLSWQSYESWKSGPFAPGTK